MRPWPLLLSVLTLTAAAQSNSAKPATGTVSGHVYCADTNAPARMARVQLESVKDADQRLTRGPQPSSGVPVGGIVQTALDGTFTLSGVPPGSYYVIASAQGYLSPRADAEDFDDAEPPPPMGQQALAIPKVDVQADQSANVDIRLERGASISGTVRFDDGSPAPGIDIVLLHKNKDNWVSSPFPNFTARASRETDDLGHYRISGLRDREYLVQAILSHVDTLSVGPHSHILHGIARSTLIIYSGNAFRRRDATPFKLGAGEERTGEDITIPLSKLHNVNGVVIAARDGHTINAGLVEISTHDDKETVTQAEIDNDGSFHLECVPEGIYLIQILHPRDHKSQDVTIGDFGSGGMTFQNEKTLHQYGDFEQTIKVEGDIPNLVLAVPELKKQPAQSAAQ